MKPKVITTICLAFAIVAPTVARGDVVYFKRGYFVEAKVIDKGDQWLLVPIAGARIRIPKPKYVAKDDIDKIAFEADFKKQFDAKLKALAPDDIKGRQELLQLCHDEHFTIYAKKLASQILEVAKKKATEAGSADALAEAGKWAANTPQRYYIDKAEAANLFKAALEVDPENESAHKGLKHKKYEDKWVTAAEYKKLAAEDSADNGDKAPSKRKRHKKKSKEPPKLWRAALLGKIPFGTKAEEIIKIWGDPEERSSRTSRQQQQEQVKYDQLTYQEGNIQVQVEFKNGGLNGVMLWSQMHDDADNDQFYLDGEPYTAKERRKALRKIASERRIGLGFTSEEVKAVLGEPKNQHSWQNQRWGKQNYWTYKTSDNKRLRITIREGRVSQISIRRWNWW